MKRDNAWGKKKIGALYENSIQDDLEHFKYIFPSKLELIFNDMEYRDLMRFMEGQTGALINGKPAYYTHDIERWILGRPNID